MAELTQKTAIITGAARGLGRACAEVMAAKGAKVIITDILDELAQEAVDNINAQGFEASFIHNDVTSEKDWQQLFDRAISKYGRIDILVNNAGIAPQLSIEDATLDDFRKSLDINLLGTFTGIKLAISHMKTKGGGSIVNVASNSTALITQASTVYSPSKAAVSNLTKVAAFHCAKEKLNIRVNSVHPGACETEMVTKHPEPLVQSVRNSIPIGRLGRPEEIGNVVAFLASDEASFVTGAEIFADGACTTFQS